MTKGKSNYQYLIIAIYCLAFLFFVFKMFFYSQYVARFPDEISHISYIAYLEESHTIIPDFKDMTVLVQNSGNINSKTDLNIVNFEKIGENYTFGDSFNQLGHPPLYYDIMSLSQAVKVNGNIVTVHILRLRCFTIALSALAMLLILYIGYSRVGKNPLLHCLYAAITVSVPMLAYDCAGINNDSLALLGLSVFLLGLLRFSENRRNYGTYFIISLGVFISFMSKLTAGTIVFVSLLIYLVLITIKEKNAWFLISKKFLASLPLYLVTAAYFLAVYLQTGTIQPTFRTLDPQGFYHSDFYVPVANRAHMNFIEYTSFYFKKFLGSWTGIGSYITSGRIGSLLSVNRIALFALLVLPLLLLFQIKRAKRNSSVMLMLISVYFGLVITAIAQWLRAYNEFANVSGYLGGFQSRYYLCGISAIALAIIFVMKSCFEKPFRKVPEKKSMMQVEDDVKLHVNYKKVGLCLICSAFICLLLYEDFIYFLIHFKNYL